jgi:hypothetical protein
MKRSKGLPALVALSAGSVLAAPALAAAAEAQSRFQVSTVVVPRARLQALETASDVVVTAEDVARGYKDLVTQYELRSNDPRGCLLTIAQRPGLAESIDVDGLPVRVRLRDAPAEVVLPWARGPQPLELRVRLNLDEAARPGTYPLPLHLAVSVL